MDRNINGIINGQIDSILQDIDIQVDMYFMGTKQIDI